MLSIEGGTFSTTAISFPFTANAGENFEWTSGTLHVGTFDGDLINQAGVLAPPDTGLTSIDGSYNQLAEAKLEIEIEGHGAGTDYDLVIVEGSAVLGGELKLVMLNGFILSSAHRFVILDADFDIVGAIANVANGQRLTTSDGFASFVVNYGAGSAFNLKQIVLSNLLAAGLPGDYNDDGTVDADDYVVWRKNVGAAAGTLPNDTDGGQIGLAQYDS